MTSVTSGPKVSYSAMVARDDFTFFFEKKSVRNYVFMEESVRGKKCSWGKYVFVEKCVRGKKCSLRK